MIFFKIDRDRFLIFCSVSVYLESMQNPLQNFSGIVAICDEKHDSIKLCRQAVLMESTRGRAKRTYKVFSLVRQERARECLLLFSSLI